MTEKERSAYVEVVDLLDTRRELKGIQIDGEWGLPVLRTQYIFQNHSFILLYFVSRGGGGG